MPDSCFDAISGVKTERGKKKWVRKTSLKYDYFTVSQAVYCNQTIRGEQFTGWLLLYQSVGVSLTPEINRTITVIRGCDRVSGLTYKHAEETIFLSNAPKENSSHVEQSPILPLEGNASVRVYTHIFVIG